MSPLVQNLLAFGLFVALCVAIDLYFRHRAKTRVSLDASAEDALKSMTGVAARRRAAASMPPIPRVTPTSEDVTPVITLRPRNTRTPTEYRQVRPLSKKG
jgi:hypothetical protein